LKRSIAIGICVLFAAVRPAFGEVVQHCALFKFKESASPAEVRQAMATIEELPSKIPGITGLQWGVNSSPEGLNKGLTHGIIVTFESVAARDAFLTHPAHAALAESIGPLVGDLFVYDLSAAKAPEAPEPGRVHHMVFFKFKDSAEKDKIDEVNRAFAALPKKVSGLLGYESGPNILEPAFNKGFNAGYLLTFTNGRARDDYLIHPAHKEFGKLVGPVLDEVLVVDFTVAPSARGLFVVEGLEPYAVYQRDEKGAADLKFRGISRDDGRLEARLRAGRRTVPGFDWKAVGKAENGVFQATLPGVPAGGEYTVELRRRDALGNVADLTEVANLLVGDLWILAGQSNMEGVGDLVDVEEPSSQVHCFTMAHRWELAVEPLHWLIDSPDPVHLGDSLKDQEEDGRRARRAAQRLSRAKGAGLGLPFAKEMVRRTGVPIGLIASAHGGTSMEQWSPAARDQGGASLYGSMRKQVKNAGGKVKGVLWYQGESDANPQAAALFTDRFKDLVAAFRADLASPQLPFYYVQIGRFVRQGDPEPWNRIQELQRLAEKEITGTAMVPVIDLALDDLIHVGTPGLKRAGRRLARIAHADLFGAPHLGRGPRLSGIEVRGDGRAIRIKYEGVNGRLLPADRVEGFSLRKKDSSEIKTIFNAAVDPASPDTVVLKLQDPLPEGAYLSYGFGLDPIANLTDGEDMAAPVFGPLEVVREKK
jgi:carbohydrate esterase-like sialic acid-specific acetylesterase/stress responsive alpha/beta barrel protein